MNIKLNEPIVLLPLRLEIRRLGSNATGQIPFAKYKLKDLEPNVTPSGKYREFVDRAEIKKHDFSHAEYWIRWYPGEIHLMTPVGKIMEEEKETWKKFKETYDRHKEAGSVHGLYKKPEYLSLEKLKIFYGLEPGRLSDEEIVKGNSYDNEARRLIYEEKKGVREVLGWQDLENPEIKQAWLEFAGKVGPVRARQIAKNEENKGKWNFDTDTGLLFRIGLEFQNDLNKAYISGSSD